MSGPRHAYVDLAVLAGELASDVSLASVVAGEPIQFNGGVPDERVAELVKIMRTRAPAAWVEPGDQSDFDWALANEGIGAGFTDDELRAVMAENRLFHDPHDRKVERGDYFARTIGKARAEANADRASHGDRPPRAAVSEASSQNGNGANPSEDEDHPHQTGEPVSELPAPSVPMDVARVFASARFAHPGGCPTLWHWRGGWWRWATSHWNEVEQRTARAWAYEFTEHATYTVREKVKGAWTEVTRPWAPNRNKVADLLEALAAVSQLPDHMSQPEWVDAPDAPGGVVVACANGLLAVRGRTLLDHDPRFFNQTAVPFAYDADVPTPERWLEFLQVLWPDDPESIAALQEWFGYVISGRLDLHKILLLVGPTRGGKGAIARVLSALIGRENVAGPTLSSLGTGFGLSTLIGKPLAVISDARLPAGRGSQTVVERLLAISGEDTIDVDRKYKDPWTGKLPSRFMVISNELPKLGDASAAIAGRFVALQLERSWLGKEDLELEPALHRELPGILNWALDGLERLAETDRFTRPASTDEAMITLQDLASPVGAFVRDCCEKGECEVDFDDLWKAWKTWAEDNGHGHGTKQTLGKDLRASVPRIRVKRPREEQAGGDEKRKTIYWGIKLS